METVATLKQENRKLTKQVKELENGGAAGKSGGATKGASSKVTQREVAALSVEHENLSAKVAELKEFLEENDHKMNGLQNRQSHSGKDVEELEDDLQNLMAENQDLNEQLEELGIQYRRVEQSLVEAKLQAATLDMEAD